MKKLFKYLREKKGIALVWLALLLFVLLVFAATAIDIAYMYYAKTQLQLASDAASLAGAGFVGGIDDTTLPDNSSILEQEEARQAAWKFACLNKAAGEGEERKSDPVYLVTDNPQDCNTDSPPTAAQLNGTTNDKNGDIVVGNWDENRMQICPSAAEDGVDDYVPFCRANGSTGFPINAIKTVARRTFNDPVTNVSIGDNPVRLFLGQVFLLLDKVGGGKGRWKFMNAVAEAIASREPGISASILICLPGCSYGGNPFCSVEEPCFFDFPRMIETGSDEKVPEEMYAWTSGLLNPTGPGFDLNSLICNEFNQNVCRKKVFTSMGTDQIALKHLESVMYDPNFDPEDKELDGEGNVFAWWITIPVLGNDEVTGCPPGEQGKWKEAVLDIIYYAKVRVIAICAGGGAGCRGYDVCDKYYDPVTEKDYNNVIVIDAMGCYDCLAGPPSEANPILVK